MKAKKKISFRADIRSIPAPSINSLAFAQIYFHHYQPHKFASSFSTHQVQFVKETAKALLIEPQKLKKEQHQNKIRKLHELNEKIFKLEARLMNNEIENSTYQTWFQKY